jgi:hypothetical protein
MKVRLPDGREVEATQMSFKPRKEDWNEYECEDGTIIKVKVIVTEIYRLEEMDPATGKHNWLVKSNNVIATVEPSE